MPLDGKIVGLGYIDGTLGVDPLDAATLGPNGSWRDNPGLLRIILTDSNMEWDEVSKPAARAAAKRLGAAPDALALFDVDA